MMKLGQVFDWVNATQTFGGASLGIERVHTDTRSLKAGDLFVALKGDLFDAHTFLNQAKSLGAVAAIAQSGLSASGLPGMEVKDTRLALGELAAGWRSQFELPLIAVTGSNGKTTVTQMIASILRVFKPDQAFATEGNLNNDIGVPLTLLRLTGSHEIGVLELGMNHPGEIAYLSQIARPSVALVNNAQREHLEFMGTVEAVAHENGSVITALTQDGTAVFPADDAYTQVWQHLAGTRKTLTFALDGAADVTGQAVWAADHWQVDAQTPFGPVQFTLQIAGQHNVKNALAAIACTLAAGVPLSCVGSGLAAFTPVKGRSRAVKLDLFGRQITLVDDTYNANPDSMQAAIDLLAGLPGPQLLVMGDMGEVGTQGPLFHVEAGQYAKGRGIASLFTLGAQAALASQTFAGGRHFEDVLALNLAVIEQLNTAGSVLIKGSRFMKLERVVAVIIEFEKTSASQMDQEAEQTAAQKVERQAERQAEQEQKSEQKDNSHAA